MKPFGPCLAEIAVYKWRLSTKMASAMGFPTETHKLVQITPVVASSTSESSNKETFVPFVMELNFGSETLLSSGAFMHCLKCAKIDEEALVRCSDSFTVCVERDFLLEANRSYVNTIRYFGPRKSNYQSYAYYVLCILGVSKMKVLENNVVETHSGYISETVKQLVYNVEGDRPFCHDDPNVRNTHSEKLKIVQVVPTTFEQMEFNEYGDDSGRRYMKMFGISFTLTNLLVLLAVVFVYWYCNTSAPSKATGNY